MESEKLDYNIIKDVIYWAPAMDLVCHVDIILCNPHSPVRLGSSSPFYR